MSDIFGIRVVPVTVVLSVILAFFCIAFLADLGGAAGQYIIDNAPGVFARSTDAPAVAGEAPGGSLEGMGQTAPAATEDVGEHSAACSNDAEICEKLDCIDASFEAIQTALE